MIEAAVEETDISKEEATSLSEDMLVGLGRLIEKRVYTLPTLQDKVCVKGGVTGEGIKALEAGVQDMFHRLFKTHMKNSMKILKQLRINTRQVYLLMITEINQLCNKRKRILKNHRSIKRWFLVS